MFDLDTVVYFKDSGRDRLTLVARIAPNVPADALRRGGANVRVGVSRHLRPVIHGDVSVRKSLTIQINAADADLYRVTVGSNGSPDTDWLLLVPQSP